MDENNKGKFVRSLLVCTKNFGKFKKGKSYKLSITLVPDVYVSYDDMGNEFSAQISESDLFSHFDYAKKKKKIIQIINQTRKDNGNNRKN